MTTTNQDALLPCPCPFCGSDPVVPSTRIDAETTWFSVECLSCGALLGCRCSAEEAVAHWNTRTRPTSGEAEPVAWVYEIPGANHRLLKAERTAPVAEGWTETPLYASPPAAPASVREALTPSGDTKAAYMGEFSFNIPDAFFNEETETFEEAQRKVYVPWDTIKEIMAAIRLRAALDLVEVGR